ncbi:DUF4198 domain-containing protein [Roseisolibacter agri]|uniref:DUF4198 domain-containing protein n=1 Tax=Roseisolibacter agri TaxID=2014610 RepID=UPI0024E1221D|nr:DUF4198 domain-containing protein [Roseisolibacter agri]
MTTPLSVGKPRGLTAYGRRALREHPAVPREAPDGRASRRGGRVPLPRSPCPSEYDLTSRVLSSTTRPPPSMSAFVRQRRASRRTSVALACASLLVAVGVAEAHDTWLLPDLFTLAAGGRLALSARAGGGKFPAGSAVPITRVAAVRLVGAATEARITDFAAEGGALRIRHVPPAAGQYRVSLSLSPGTIRSTPAGLLRFLRLEGGAAEAQRVERLGLVTGEDSLVFVHAASASTVVEVGRGGPRAYQRAAGLPLEFLPVNDPLALAVGDTLHVRVTGDGQPVAGIGVEYKPAADTLAAGATPPAYLSAVADGRGIAHLPLTAPGLWIVRAAYVSPRAGNTPREYAVSRATFVWQVRARP